MGHKCINCGYEILNGEQEGHIRMSRQDRYYHASFEGCQSAQNRKPVRWWKPTRETRR